MGVQLLTNLHMKEVIRTKNRDIATNAVFVCGGGHQGLSMAAHLALNGLEVTLWNRTSKNIEEVIMLNVGRQR